MTERIREFLRKRNDEGPCLVVDLDVVKVNYNAFAKALPDTRVFYAVKANPAPEVLALLAKLGSCFDPASVAETEMVLAAGATPDRISFGNTIKKERDIARAFALGVRLYAVDCKAEVEKVARAAPGSRVFCRILSDCAGAEWPLSRKFGCEPSMAVDVLEHALRLGLEPYGVSFHVGSQQRNQHAFDRDENLADPVFRLAHLLGLQALAVRHLGVGNRRLVAELLAQHLGPAKLRAYLVDQRALADAVGRQLLAQRTGGQAIARLYLVDRVGNVLIRHDDVPALHFLHAQPFVDELAGDLRLEP